MGDVQLDIDYTLKYNLQVRDVTFDKDYLAGLNEEALRPLDEVEVFRNNGWDTVAMVQIATLLDSTIDADRWYPMEMGLFVDGSEPVVLTPKEMFSTYGEDVKVVGTFDALISYYGINAD
jgi:hypothetical protein